VAELEIRQTTTEFPGHPAPHSDAGGIGTFSVPLVPIPDDSDDDRPVGGISVIPVPRREIARLKGTLRLSGLPRHKPAIVLDASPASRDDDDE
jgi:hypothetical protein